MCVNGFVKLGLPDGVQYNEALSWPIDVYVAAFMLDEVT